MSLKALLIDPKDNVATAIRQLEKGETFETKAGEMQIQVTLCRDIPLGHKFALRKIPVGEPVIKYGETIGLATCDIAAGEHVHIHNVEGRKGRGDRI
jgi:altronate dehydratase small subunit